MSDYRVISESRGIYYLALDQEIIRATLSGRYRYEFNKNPLLLKPVVGDYVCLDENGRINEVINRKNTLSRKCAGKKMQMQVMAANLDFLYITMPLDKEFNANKISRFIMLATINNITPIVVLTKKDLCENPEDYISQIRSIDNIPIIITSTNDREGFDKIANYMCPGTTSAFVGPSGAGKSTIVNCLLNKSVQKTQDVRDSDNKGRHTTTARQLVFLDNMAAIIDTPGIREIGFWLNDLDFEVEETIYDLMGKCKFSNCTHISEPGCKVIEALHNNIINQNQYRQLLKYKSEIMFLKSNQRHDIISIKNKNKKIQERKNNQRNRSY